MKKILCVFLAVIMLMVLLAGCWGSSSSSSSGAKRCVYKYSDGVVCGRRVKEGYDFCETHWNELMNTYNSITGK